MSRAIGIMNGNSRHNRLTIDDLMPSTAPSTNPTLTIGLYKKLFGSDAAIELNRSVKTTADLLAEMERQINLYLNPPECTCQPAELLGYSLACPVCRERAAGEEMEF